MEYYDHKRRGNVHKTIDPWQEDLDRHRKRMLLSKRVGLIALGSSAFGLGLTLSGDYGQGLIILGSSLGVAAICLNSSRRERDLFEASAERVEIRKQILG
jgi:hypothetical protein